MIGTPAPPYADARKGFTLLEIMVTIGVFMAISTAMIGILAAAGNIYRAGERGRAANTEAMAVFGLIDRDLDRAVPPQQGGRFYAHVINAQTGACAVGWTIHTPTAGVNARGRHHRFVVYGLDDHDSLRRREFDSLDDPDFILSDPFDQLDPSNSDRVNRPGSIRGEVITEGCLHFGVWLMGVSATSDGAPAWDPRERTIAPELTDAGESMFWTMSRSATDRDLHTPPYAPDPYISDPAHGDLPYPSAMRLTVMFTAEGRLRPLGQLVADAAADEMVLRIGGLDGLATGPGTLVRVGESGVDHLRRNPTHATIPRADYELIAYSDYRDGEVVVNTSWSRGPLDPITDSGRGVYRSVASDRQRRATVTNGRQYALTRHFGP
ncbi:MAG: PulJ/GspJ family protein [Planctomycetota bacterium]